MVCSCDVSLRATLFGIIVAAFAATRCYANDPCSGMDVSEVRSLAAIPAGIRQLLFGIADRGGRFNIGDALTPETAELPMRRLTLAAVGATCAVVGVEFGGIASGFDALEFRLDGGNRKWICSSKRPRMPIQEAHPQDERPDLQPGCTSYKQDCRSSEQSLPYQGTT
jgi:hypothetical protein